MTLTRIEELFEHAAALPPEARGAFLDAGCQGDPSLRTAVEGLLQADAALGPDDDFLRGPVVGARPAAQDECLAIEGYRILRKIGVGGMGSVYEAEQENPRRRVAIKLIRPGMATPETIKRFALEAQVLGRLRHPGIAQIHQAGLTASGQPFIAMEFIQGPMLVDYARQHSLDVPARIDLLAVVCDAVQHAHRRASSTATSSLAISWWRIRGSRGCSISAWPASPTSICKPWPCGRRRGNSSGRCPT